MTHAKDDMGKIVASVDLHVDHEVLRQKNENQSKIILKEFSMQLHAFASDDSDVKYGKAAKMPVFSKNVVHVLTNDLCHTQHDRV